MVLFELKNDRVSGRTTVRLFGLKMSFINKKLVSQPDYSAVLSKIQNKYKNNQKIRVGFLVNENCKWNAENLYNILEENEKFEPVVLITLYNTRHFKKDFTKSSVQDNYDFFVKSGKRVVKAYDEVEERYLNIEDFDIDIVFYQQPWGYDSSQYIDAVSKHSLCMYYSYGISVLENPLEVRPFHEKLFMYFIPNEETKVSLKKFEINNLDNMEIVGYPKLDIYNDIELKNSAERKTIIYAPHHSYNRGLRIGTFDKIGEQVLAYAKDHGEYNWIFKPHPDLKEVLYKDRKYGAEFSENYYAEWAKIGKIYDKGNYFEQFASSDILITDCDAFLLEYMPTLKPIIRLEARGSAKLSPLGVKIVEGIYRVRGFKELKNVLEDLKKTNADILLEKRKEITDTILRKTKNSSGNIVAELEKLLV